MHKSWGPLTSAWPWTWRASAEPQVKLSFCVVTLKGWSSAWSSLSSHRHMWLSWTCPLMHCKENSTYVFLFWELRGFSPNFLIHVYVSRLYIPRIGPHISLQQKRQTDLGNTYINLSQIYECRNWETENYNSVFEITVSFLGIHKWEPDIYIGFSPALHLQCVPVIKKQIYCSKFSSVWNLICNRIVFFFVR